ncbi:MAG: hypothetical protein RLZZ352_2190 [Pseudomonadota bacterium]|jgi:uroporphyrinogen-III synthase
MPASLSAPATALSPGTRLTQLVVTRPAQEAQTWVQALQAQGWPAQPLPLIAITPPADPAQLAELQRFRAQCVDWDVLMFVSAAAVQHFFDESVPAPAAGAHWPRCWAPGPGTARALVQALAARGLSPAWVDAPAPDVPQFDSEALWAVVAPQLHPGLRLGWVRGGSAGRVAPIVSPSGLAGQGRDWLIQQCQAAGAVVQACVAYVRSAPVLSHPQQMLLQTASQAGSLWLFSSTEAVLHLRQLADPAADWAAACALTTHPRIAAAARAAGFGSVLETRPALADVLRVLEQNWSRP